jgi:hypothetical protein
MVLKGEERKGDRPSKQDKPDSDMSLSVYQRIYLLNTEIRPIHPYSTHHDDTHTYICKGDSCVMWIGPTIEGSPTVTSAGAMYNLPMIPSATQQL